MSAVSLTYETFPTLWLPRHWLQPSVVRRLPSSANLIVDDGEPMESPKHLNAMTILIDSLQQGWAHRDDFYVGGNMFVYFSDDQVKTEDYRGPDFFVVLHTDKHRDRDAWIVWEEQGRTPSMVVELLSPSTKTVDLTKKKEIYRTKLKTPDYFVFDPKNPTEFRGWHLVKERYQELKPNKKGWLWCESLGLWLGPWTGTLKQQTRTWLRFYDTDGQLLPMPEEVERQQKEMERQQKEMERQQKEMERQQKEQALLVANEALQQVAMERQKSDKLRELLRAHGISVEGLE